VDNLAGVSSSAAASSESSGESTPEAKREEIVSRNAMAQCVCRAAIYHAAKYKRRGRNNGGVRE